MSAGTEYADAGFVIASSYRTTVLERLSESPATPSTIAEDTPISIAHVSRALQELRERDYAELLVPEERHKGRIYGATDRGVEAAQKVRELNGGDNA
jgi:DNA-binding MarR family transcriptional regulator